VDANQIARLFADSQWAQIASQIDTGTETPSNSRALIVFNPTSNAHSGIALFHVDMPWRDGRELPSILVKHLATAVFCNSGITHPRVSPAVSGQTHGRIQFEIWFKVSEIPAEGWDTYIAEYESNDAQSHSNGNLPAANLKLTVVETTRHEGKLSPRFSVNKS
jgi:hypothetical protein